MEFVGETRSYYDVIGTLWIVGEVENQGDTAAEFVKVSAIAYKEDGSVHSTDFTYALRDIVPVGERSPYSIMVDDDAREVVDYKLSVTSRDADQPAPDGAAALKIQGTNTNVDSIGYYHVVGEVVNHGTSTYEFVKIIATLYDAEGMIVAADYTYADPSDIAPGASSGFDLFHNTEYGSPASYTLWVEGRVA